MRGDARIDGGILSKGKRTRMPRFRVGEDEGRRALLRDGVILSVAIDGDGAPSGYWAAMLPEGSPRNALLLGLAGGTLAHLLARRYPAISMVGVDADADLIVFALEHFDLAMPNLEVVVADAFDYVGRCDRSFDFIAVDLFVGYDLQRGVLARPFLRRLKALAAKRGEIAFNLFRDRRTAQHLERIGRVLRVTHVDEVGKNVVVHCRG